MLQRHGKRAGAVPVMRGGTPITRSAPGFGVSRRARVDRGVVAWPVSTSEPASAGSTGSPPAPEVVPWRDPGP